MQKIQKFQPSKIYSAPKSKNTFELLDRTGHYLVFLVRKPKDRTTYKITATSFFRADQNGAFEEVLLQDGTRIRSDSGTDRSVGTYSSAA
jgi:hypothetical protein